MLNNFGNELNNCGTFARIWAFVHASGAGDVRAVWVSGFCVGAAGLGGCAAGFEFTNAGISHPLTFACRSVCSSHIQYPLFCPISTKIGMHREHFVKLPSIKFCEHPFSGSRVITSRHRNWLSDRHGEANSRIFKLLDESASEHGCTPHYSLSCL